MKTTKHRIMQMTLQIAWRF